MPNSPNPQCFRGRSSKPAHLESQAIRSKRRPPTHCPGPKRLVSTRPPTPTHPASTKQLVLCATSPGWGKTVAPSNNRSLEQPSHRLPTLGSIGAKSTASLPDPVATHRPHLDDPPTHSNDQPPATSANRSLPSRTSHPSGVPRTIRHPRTLIRGVRPSHPTGWIHTSHSSRDALPSLPQSGVLRSRGGPLERAAARVCREAGARVTTHTRLADLNVQHVQHIDDRRIEVIANGLALWGGAQLAVDTTLVSPLTRAGRRAGRFAGEALTDARKAKERAYPELLRNSRCRLVVLGIEVGGRWSEEAASFITSLARTKIRDTPAPLRHAAATSLISRWTALLTHAAMTAFAASLLFEDPTNHHNLDGEPPSLSDLLAQPDPTDPSRLPPR